MIKLSKTNKQHIDPLVYLLFNEKREYLKFFTAFKDESNFIKEIQSKKNIFYSIFIQRKISGFVMLRGIDFPQIRFGIYLESNMSEKGYSKKIISNFLDIAKKNYKINEIYLKVNKNNYKGLSLYKSIGFEIKEVEGNSYIMCINL